MSRQPQSRAQAQATGEHDDEPQNGLPEALPAGERLLWQGSPDWRVLARHGFHFNAFVAYFAALTVWRGAAVALDGGSAGAVAVAVLWTLPLAALALGFIVLLAWLVGRSAVYTLTDRRVVMRVGIVLTVTFNLPLTRIHGVSLHGHGRGGSSRSGDLALQLHPYDRIGYVHLWPHARPWRFSRPEPLLRALPQAEAAAKLLVQALAPTAVAAATDAAPRPRAATPAAVRQPQAQAA